MATVKQVLFLESLWMDLTAGQRCELHDMGIIEQDYLNDEGFVSIERGEASRQIDAIKTVMATVV